MAIKLLLFLFAFIIHFPKNGNITAKNIVSAKYQLT